MDERAMYETDRNAWMKHVAPRMASRLVAATDEQIKRDWNGMARDYQTAVWQHLDETQRARIRTLRTTA